MTERWRKELEGIDDLGPSDEVYQRAKNGPNLPDPQSPMKRTSTRVVTAIAAFVVFALGISVFAIPALRLRESARPLGGGQLPPLWPVQSTDEVQALQAQADSGEASWALDPREIAARFGRSVLGWPHAWAGQTMLPSDVPSCGVPSGDYPATATPMLLCGGQTLAPVSPATISGCEPGAACAFYEGATTGPPSQFMEFQVLPCAPEDRCEPTYDGESVTLFQPAGSADGGIWAVVEASSVYLRLSALPGAIVRDAETLTALSAVPDESRTTLGYGTHAGPCAASDSTSAFKPAGSEVHDLVPNAAFLAASDAQLEVHLTGVSDSCHEAPGYVFSAIRGDANGTEPVQDPIAGATNGQALAAFIATPVTFEWPEEVANSTPPSSSPSELAWTTYTDTLGWTIDVPSDWGITDVTDELIVSAPGGVPYVQINRVPNDPLRDDSSFPLDYTAMANEPQAHFRGAGQAFIIQWLTGDGSAPTPEQAAEFDRITRSIAFPATTLGVTQGGWTAVGPILRSASAEWVTYKSTGDHYIAALTAGSTRTAFGPAPTCSGGGGSYEVRETGAAGITCSDGTGGDWSFTTGEPKAANSAGFDLPLHALTAVRSWDGWLLAQLPTGPTPTASPP